MTDYRPRCGRGRARRMPAEPFVASGRVLHSQSVRWRWLSRSASGGVSGSRSIGWTTDGRAPGADPRCRSGCKGSTTPSPCFSASRRFARTPTRGTRPGRLSTGFTLAASDAESRGQDPDFSLGPRDPKSGHADGGRIRLPIEEPGGAREDPPSDSIRRTSQEGLSPKGRKVNVAARKATMPEPYLLKSKICLVGERGVGKSSLIRRYVLDQFDDKYVRTLGAKVEKKTMRLDLREGHAQVDIYMPI